MHALSLPIKPVWTFAKGTRMADENAKEEAEKALSVFPSFVLFLFSFYFFGGSFFVLKALL